MDFKGKGPSVGITSGLIQSKSQPQCSSKPPFKWCRVLDALARGELLHRFLAERLYHDHTLPSTISELQRKGVMISRREERVPGYRGEPAYVALYWLDTADAENMARARALLAGQKGAAS